MPRGRKKTISQVFEATLAVNGLILKSSGSTVLEALNGLNPLFYKTKGILTVFKDDKKYEKILAILQMKRLFNEFPCMTRDIARLSMAKFIEQGLK